MKRISTRSIDSLPDNFATLWQAWRRHKYPSYLFLALCINLIFASGVFASTGETMARSQAYALGLLAFCTVILSVYLFVVMFQPERF
ncbi:potassium-transporting ATPase subunit F [Microcoleus sp. FACHB-1515]|uniref:potassium-transporting ATPase subunit F n=1 Tax=Cyanophyceae TaxID=3028117 RepID=UPI0016851030|nr:potassium-transporting ATPase subunit F [Microcoleus sp. FACHB-1515]MBD2088736.1 potassium-transporting ATPase subunit F [Microcoleus sp. FACHB-1515]